MNRKSSTTVRKAASEITRATRSDLDRLASLPDGQPDRGNPQWTPRQIGSAVRARRARVLQRAGQGSKERITIHLDADIVAFFRALGEHGYQTRINDALRAYVAHHAAAGGGPRKLIEQARSTLARVEKMLGQGDAA